MTRSLPFGTLVWLSIASLVAAQQAGTATPGRISLGRLANGAAVTFVRAGSGDWGIEISGGTAPRLMQQKLAQIEVFRGEENVQQVAVGYQSVIKESDAVVATAKVSDGGRAAFVVEDRWTVSDAVLSLSRKVSVTGAEDNAGFYSAIRLTTDAPVEWDDVTCLVPGLVYGDPSHAGGGVPTSTANAQVKRFSVREDYLSAPLFGMILPDGSWAAVLDMAPRGDTTQEETTASAATTIVDDRLQFGALGAQEVSGGGIELGFWLPGTTTEIGGRRGFGRRGGAAPTATPTESVRRRYHPVKAGLTQSYQVGFRFGKAESFRDMERDAWRWAWESLDPKVTPMDVEVMRTALMDHLADRVQTVDDRSGIPYQANTLTGRANSTKIQMSFCGKNIEAADQLLLEGDRDTTERGQRMRELGLVIIESFVRIVPMSPPGGSGFDIRTGQAITGNPGAMYLRAGSEEMPFLLDAYQREKKAGRDHPGLAALGLGQPPARHHRPRTA